MKVQNRTGTEIESKRGRQIEGAIDREGERERERERKREGQKAGGTRGGGDKRRGGETERQREREGERYADITFFYLVNQSVSYLIS